MKSLVLILLSVLTVSIAAGEVTGAGAAVNAVLRQHQMSVQTLQREGHKVILGEVTGAGKTVQLDQVKFIVTKKSLHNLDNSTHIQFVHPSAAKTMGDVQFIEFDRKKVDLRQIKAMILK